MAARTIQSIKDLGEHDCEIIVTSPLDLEVECKNVGAKFIEDAAQKGSVFANNNAYTQCEGDLIFVLPDDFHLVNLDIEEFKEFWVSDKMEKKTFKMFTLYNITGHKIDEFGKLRLEKGYITYETPINEPYIVMHFPVLDRETIENELNGVIFNHRFAHNFCDHWLGYIASRREEYKPYNYSLFKDCQTSFVELNSHTNLRNPSAHRGDYKVLEDLYKLYLIHDIEYNE